MVGLILLGCSNTHDFNGLPAGAVILGLAGITFHLSQLHISNLFPRSRGFISSLLVAGFTGCGVIFYLLDLIFVAVGGSRSGLPAQPLLSINAFWISLELGFGIYWRRHFERSPHTMLSTTGVQRNMWWSWLLWVQICICIHLHLPESSCYGATISRAACHLLLQVPLW